MQSALKINNGSVPSSRRLIFINTRYLRGNLTFGEYQFQLGYLISNWEQVRSKTLEMMQEGS
jgi:hypothetical protein